jgi:hypothetical protein
MQFFPFKFSAKFSPIVTYLDFFFSTSAAAVEALSVSSNCFLWGSGLTSLVTPFFTGALCTFSSLNDTTSVVTVTYLDSIPL